LCFFQRTCTDLSETRTVALPSDSHFAVAMKNQQQAEREEQQRIKNLVLNYDLRENEDPDGEFYSASLVSNNNIHNSGTGNDKATSHYHNRADNRSVKGGQRVRKLQLSDVDWYENPQKYNSSSSSVSGMALPSRPGSFGSWHRKHIGEPLSDLTTHREASIGNSRMRPSRGGHQLKRGWSRHA